MYILFVNVKNLYTEGNQDCIHLANQIQLCNYINCIKCMVILCLIGLEELPMIFFAMVSYFIAIIYNDSNHRTKIEILLAD